MRFGFHRREEQKSYDPALEEPVIRSSICTGEKTAGFRNRTTGEFRDVCLIRDQADMDHFRKAYGIEDEIRTIW